MKYLYTLARKKNTKKELVCCCQNGAKRSLLERTPVSSRIITERLKSRVRPVSIIQCYAPTSVDETEETFCGILNTTVAKIKKRDIITLMGDLNAKIGRDNKGIEQIVGKHAPGERNDNVERFTELCGNYNLVIEVIFSSQRMSQSCMGFTR
jgi:hypothetical protein